jgi:excinuclease UvrABC nuclease subunit
MQKAYSASGASCYGHLAMAAVLTRKRKLTEENVGRVPATTGVYILYGTQGSPAYVGRSQPLHARLANQIATGRIPAAAFAYVATGTMAEASKLEHDLVQRLLPRFNIHGAP